jgi:hypothetical protein
MQRYSILQMHTPTMDRSLSAWTPLVVSGGPSPLLCFTSLSLCGPASGTAWNLALVRLSCLHVGDCGKFFCSQHDTCRGLSASCFTGLTPSERTYVLETIYYLYPGLCRVAGRALTSAFYQTLGKEAFAESRIRQSPALGNELVYVV